METQASIYLKENGYYHGKEKLSPALITEFKREFDLFFEEKRKRFFSRFESKSNYSANHDINRWNMLLPSDSEMMKSGFFGQDDLFQTIRTVFDDHFALVFFSSDISSPGSAFQTIHQDGNDFAVALNVPLVDSDEQNGATHIYPKTHRVAVNAPFTNESNKFSDDEIILRAEQLDPFSLDVKIGDYTLRDLRLIHRGTPNKTTEQRPYLSSIFLPSSENQAPTFESINYGLKLFKQFKDIAFPSGKTELIDYANTFGRLVLGFSYSDRVNRPIPKHISDQLNENALYCLRFAFFEDEKLNERIIRNVSSSEELLHEIETAKVEFEQLAK
jgi:ectoine hydroxylase-related dioxygenase (phytanoyl-CoA dioxygenase family)